MAVDRVVGAIEVESDLPRRHLVRLEEEVHEQALDRPAVVADLVVAAWRQRGLLEPVQGAFAGEWRAQSLRRASVRFVRGFSMLMAGAT